MRKNMLAMTMLFIMIVGLNAQHSRADMPHVALIETMTVPIVQEFAEAFLEEFQRLGYEDGATVRLQRMNAEGSYDKAEELLQAMLAEGRPDVVVTVATLASQAAFRLLQGTEIPMVFFGVVDPVGAGLIQEIGVPGGANITGKVHTVPPKAKIELAMAILRPLNMGRPIRFGYIHSTYPVALADLERLQRVAQTRDDITFVPYQVPYRDIPDGTPDMLRDVRAGIDALAGHIDFLWEPRGALTVQPEYTRTLLDHASVPILVGSTTKSVQMGALLHITADPEFQGREVANMVDAILKGQSAGSIAPSLAREIEFAVNLSTAVQMKLVIPDNILELAGPNIYH